MGYTEINTVCDLCVFKCDSCEACEFEFLRKYLSSLRVPDDCPRGIPRNANWGKHQSKRKRRTRPLSEYELQVLDAMRTHPSDFGLKYQQVINLFNGHKPGKRSSKYININAAKRMMSALQVLRVRGFVRAKGGRWFLPEARGVAESNPEVIA